MPLHSSRIFWALLLALGISTAVWADAPVYSSPATPGGGSSFEPEEFIFTLGDATFRIRHDGHGVRRVNSSEQRFRLPIEAGDRLYRVSFLPLEGDLLILFEFGDEEASAGSVIRLDHDTLSQEWSAWIYGFNIGTALLFERSLYLTAIGFVGRLDVSTGKYVWEHRNLYQEFAAFTSFDKPSIRGALIEFKEILASYEHRPAKVLVANLASGEYTVHDLTSP